jgi:hypothetical protein
MVDGTGGAERIALRRFLREWRGATTPLVIITERTIITNAAAERVIAANDELTLRECAVWLRVGKYLPTGHVALSNGAEAIVTGEPLLDGLSPVGVILRLSELDLRRSPSNRPGESNSASGSDSLTETEGPVASLIGAAQIDCRATVLAQRTRDL